MTLHSTISGLVCRYVYVCKSTRVFLYGKKIRMFRQRRLSTTHDHLCSVEAGHISSLKAKATGGYHKVCNEFKARLRPEAADGKQLLLGECVCFSFFFCTAQTKPLCVRNNSYSWAQQSETSIHKLVPLHPSECSSGSQEEQQRMPELGQCTAKKIISISISIYYIYIHIYFS